jgi:hypothetical protein
MPKWLKTLQHLGRALKQRRATTTAVISLYHTCKLDREAIQDAMQAQSIRPIFVIMHTTEETLYGRTLGAEEPELTRRIMEQKIADI